MSRSLLRETAINLLACAGFWLFVVVSIQVFKCPEMTIREHIDMAPMNFKAHWINC